ncbi:MAG: hypothetical protein WBB45_00470 [Cyclobacteriaceae bacterium]
MLVVDHLQHNDCRITLFEWNGKYLIKFERGLVELTYKVSQMEIPNNEELKSFIDDSFIKEALQQLTQMEVTLGHALERHQ